MTESHIEGLADHNDPVAGRCIREDTCEAMTGGNTGGVLSCKKGMSRVPTPSTCAEGNADMRKKGECMSDPAQSETPCMYGNSMRENRKSLYPSSEDGAEQRDGKNKVRNPAMSRCGRSDRSIMPAKLLNKAGTSAAEAVAGRGLTKGNEVQQKLIKKWLKAGVIEDGRRTKTDEGTPQGASISPLISNIHLHLRAGRTTFCVSGGECVQELRPSQPGSTHVFRLISKARIRWSPRPLGPFL